RVLQREPNRLRPTLGALQAAEKSGDAAKAKAHAAKAVELTADADAPRPEVLRARQVASRG
ncbi:MAG: hypothetical protein V4750_06330, partial [Pseudomonadota bacterium]